MAIAKARPLRTANDELSFIVFIIQSFRNHVLFSMYYKNMEFQTSSIYLYAGTISEFIIRISLLDPLQPFTFTFTPWS